MKVIILAGGSGTRLWPLSRYHFPKQFLPIQGKESLLRKTVLRNLKLVDPKDLYILSNKEHFHQVAKEAPEIAQSHIILEPAKKNTAPALALAIKFLEEAGVQKEEPILVVPSDHLLSPTEQYISCITQGLPLAAQELLVVFGVYPHKPETGFGYIKAEGNRVVHFVEKPKLAKAQEYVVEGNYYWNAGIFLFALKTIQEEFALHAPEILTPNTSFSQFVEAFPALPENSIDYAILEKSARVAMVPLTLSWSDVGSWENVYELYEKDAQGNAVQGEVKTFETTNSLVFSEKRLVATMGIDNMVVVETKDALLVARKDFSQKIKTLVETLQKEGKQEALEHLTTFRPWGAYTVLEEQERYKIKKIEVQPKQKLSLQLHYHRSEHWVVVKGSAKVTIGDRETLVHEGESIFVPKAAVHRVENPGKVVLEIIEVQVGEYLGEDDIIRLEDSYGRLKEEETFKLLQKSIQK